MTRVLVTGVVLDDQSLVHNTLCEINRTYGPISCVIHQNHSQALTWQQWASRHQQTKHLPITEDWAHDGVVAPRRAIERMFAAKPDYVVVFETVDPKDTSIRPRTQAIIYRAQREGIEVLTYQSHAKRHGRPKVATKFSELAA
jgi:hypothetical protein